MDQLRVHLLDVLAQARRDVRICKRREARHLLVRDHRDELLDGGHLGGHQPPQRAPLREALQRLRHVVLGLRVPAALDQGVLQRREGKAELAEQLSHLVVGLRLPRSAMVPRLRRGLGAHDLRVRDARLQAGLVKFEARHALVERLRNGLLHDVERPHRGGERLVCGAGGAQDQIDHRDERDRNHGVNEGSVVARHVDEVALDLQNARRLQHLRDPEGREQHAEVPELRAGVVDEEGHHGVAKDARNPQREAPPLAGGDHRLHDLTEDAAEDNTLESP
mmetsp:Transcript_21723/g.57430  ORF Transcript_21723/g.57430 Transcript_21723/m.57430 type:complete len:278 (+) Transcript_21723:370-1203(+)